MKKTWVFVLALFLSLTPPMPVLAIGAAEPAGSNDNYANTLNVHTGTVLLCIEQVWHCGPCR
jgi:hypothetical protein